MGTGTPDRDGFKRFYEATAASVRAYILRHCRDRGAVDDLFQITYIKFLQSRKARSLPGPKARAYLYRIASNAITDHGRKLQRRRKFQGLYASAAATTEKPTVPEGPELRKALRTLSVREQQLLWLVYAEGFTHKEVAGIMRLSSASVRVLAFRARKKLARRLGAEENPESAKRP